MMTNVEGVSERFNLDTYLEARKIARKISFLCASHIEDGMSEDDGLAIIDKLMQMHDVNKTWHPTKFRIGQNTTKSFREKSDANLKLQKEDIYFLDIGPVIKGHEADIGHTYTVGQNLKYANIQKTAKEVFFEVQKKWQSSDLSGIELYNYAKSETEKRGYIFNVNMAGHRLGDFPHALFYKGKLSDFDKTPIENLWVLEIHIIDKSHEFGAFYEDVLLKTDR